MKRAWLVAGVVSASWGLLACEEITPTSSDGGLIPLDPRTVEIVLPFGDFAEGVQTFSGFGTPSELFEAVLAQDFEGSLDSRVITRFNVFPWLASVVDSTGTTRADSAFTFLGGYLVARFDTTEANRPDGPVQVSVGALNRVFYGPSASWTVAVDTINDLQLWDEPGAGPVMPLGSAEWDPSLGDSVVFELDSATVATLGDTLEAGPGVRFDLETPGVRINLVDTDLRLRARPNIHQDTVVILDAPPVARTFIYDPLPDPEEGGIRVGGAPSWRSVITLDLPEAVQASPQVCALVGCPLELTPERLNSATLILTTAASQAAFQPADSLFLDARAVLAPDLLPKSPLGTSLVGALGVSIAPEWFGDDAGQTVSIPVTTFVRSLVDDSVGQKVRDLVLLTPLEPLSIGFGTFAGPGTGAAPRLRLILTVTDTVEIR